MPIDRLNESSDELSLQQNPSRAAADETLAVRVTQAEIDDILNDPTLSPADRKARLDDLRERMIDQEGDDYAGQYTTFETRIMDAFSMVAEGGHDYAPPPEEDGIDGTDDPVLPPIQATASGFSPG